MPTYLDSKISPELDVLKFQNASQQDIDLANFAQSSQAQIDSLSAGLQIDSPGTSTPSAAPSPMPEQQPDTPIAAPTPQPLPMPTAPAQTPAPTTTTASPAPSDLTFQDTQASGDQDASPPSYGAAPASAPAGSPVPAGAPPITPRQPSLTSGPPAGAADWESKAYAAAVKAGHPNPSEFVEQIRQESGGNPNAVSAAGARGIAQITLPTAADWGVDPLNPDAALAAAAQHMAAYYQTYGDSAHALAAYNMGEGNLAKYGPRGLPETATYIDRIQGSTRQAAPTAQTPVPSPGAAAQPSAMPTGQAPSEDISQAALDDPDKWALCGPVAAIIAASQRGGNWTIAQAKKLAVSNGLWDADNGMHGLGTEVALLKQMGVDAATGVADAGKLAADALAGNTPIVSTIKHYFVLKGYDPDTQRFDTSTTGGVFRGGSRWMTLDQIEKLGGGIQGAAYLDNPSSPVSSVATQTQDTGTPSWQNQTSTGTDQTSSAPSAATAMSTSASPAPMMYRQPLSMATSGPDSNPTWQDSQTEPASPPTDRSGTFTPERQIITTPESDPSAPYGALPSNPAPYDPSFPDPEASRNETVPGLSTPQDVGPARDNPYGSWKGMIDRRNYLVPNDLPPDVYGGNASLLNDAPAAGAGASTSGPGASYPSAGAFQDDQTQNGYAQPDMAPGPPVPDMRGTSNPDPTQPAASPLKPLYDLGGNIMGYVHTGLDAAESAANSASDAVSAAVPQIGPALNAAGLPDVATPVIKTARGAAQGIQESMSPEGTYLNQASDLGTWIGNGIRAATGRDPVETPQPTGAVAQAMDAARRAGYALVSGSMQANVAADIWKEFGLPTTEIAGLEINPGVFLVPGHFAGGGVEAAAGPAAGRVAGAFENIGDRAATAARGVVGAGFNAASDAVRSGIGRVGQALDENAGRVAALDAERAQQGAIATPGVFGVAPPEAGQAAADVTRPRFVPPEVRMQTTPNMELPDDPRFAQAVEAHGGRITPDGAEVYVTRAQGADAAGQTATRGGVFAEAVPEGGQSSYARSADDPNAVGGSQVLPPTKTLYRRPIVLDSEPGSSQGFDAAAEKLGITTPPDPVEIARLQQNVRDLSRDLEMNRQYGSPAVAQAQEADLRWYQEQLTAAQAPQPARARSIDAEIFQAQRAGPPGSPERAQALKDLVSRYGGDPSTIDDLLKIRASDASESQWAIKENIVAGNARRQGVDGVFTIKPGEASWNQINQHPLVVAALKKLEAGTSNFEERIANEEAYYAAQKEAERLLNAPQIKEVFDVQQGKNPTPGAPNPRIAEAVQAEATARDAYAAVRDRFFTPDLQRRLPPGPGVATEAELRSARDAHDASVAALEQARQEASGAPGYSLHPEMQQRVDAQKTARQLAEEYKVAREAWRTSPTEAAGNAAEAEMQRIQRLLSDKAREERAAGVDTLAGLPASFMSEPPASTTAAGTAGVVPIPMRTAGDVGASVAASKGFFDKATPILSQGVASAVSGGVGAATAAVTDPGSPQGEDESDADYAARRARERARRMGAGFVAGAVAPYALARGAGALARGLGRDAQGAEGALATIGHVPGKQLPNVSASPQQIAAEAAKGARRGEMLNREVKPPESQVPGAVRAVTKITDPLAATRWAENLLTDAAGSPRLPENSPERASTQLRVNPTGLIKDRIDNELAPIVTEAAKKGLHNELPQYVADVHERDILDEFNHRGYQAAIAAGDQQAQAQLDRVDKVVKGRLDQAEKRASILEKNGNQAQADSVRRVAQNNASQTMTNAQVVADKLKTTPQQAQAAGEATMRQRAGSNPEFSYENLDAKIKGQEDRLGKTGQLDDLQRLAQGVWDTAKTSLRNAVDAGRVEPQVAADLMARYPHYVPTVPISHLDPSGKSFGASSGGSVLVSASKTGPIHALEDVGSGSERLNPIVAIRNQIISGERQNQQNRVFQAFKKLHDDALQAGSPLAQGSTGPRTDFWNGERNLTGLVAGTPTSVRVPAPVANGIESMVHSGMGADDAVNAYKRVIRWFSSQLTAGRASYAPLNLVRDAGDTMYNAMVKGGGIKALPGIMGPWMDEAGKAVLDVARAQANPRSLIGGGVGAAYGASLGDENTTPGQRVQHAIEGGIAGSVVLGANKNVPISSKAARDFELRGGASGGISSGLGAGQRWYRDVMRDGGATIRSPGDMARFMADWGHDIINLQGAKGINERLDMVGRSAAMRNAERAGASPTEAMIAGRDSSYDADRAGTVLRAINGVVPFTNATVQGAAQFTRAWRDHPLGVMATVATTLAPTMLAVEAWNRSDPERAKTYDNVPQYLKDSGIVFVPGGNAGSDTRGSMPKYVWIPTEIATPFVVGLRLALQHLDKVVPGLQPAAGRSDVDQNAGPVAQWGGALNEALQIFNPVHGDTASAIASNFIPPPARAALEIGLNKDLYRGSTIQTTAADERASALSRSASGGLNAAGRGLSGLGLTGVGDMLQNAHPSQVEHILQAAPAYNDILSGLSDQVNPSPYKRAEQGRLANEPFVGGIGARFVRDAGGANLERTQAGAMTPNLRGLLSAARMHPADVDLTVPSDYKNAPLTRDEQLRWQQAMNAALPLEIAKVRSSSDWAIPATRQQAVKTAISDARDIAAQRALTTVTDGVIQQRVQQEQRRKATVSR